VLNLGHTYGTITDTVDIIKTKKIGKHLNTVEEFHIHKINKNKLHMCGTHTLKYIT
jgi:hypothetical protein